MDKSTLSRLKSRIKATRRRIIKTFRSPQGKEAFTFLCFVALAFCFWFILVISDNRERIVQIPIELTDIPEETVLLNDMPPYIEARIRDKGPVVLSYNLNNISPIKIDFTRHDNHKDAITISNNNLIDYARKQLKATTTILAFTPDSIRITYTHDQGKKCPIVTNGTYTTVPHCILGEKITASPDSATIYGKAATLNTIDKIQTEEIILNDLKDTTRVLVRLKHIPGTRIIPDNTTVTIPVEEYTTKTLSVPIAISHVPSGYSVMTFPSHIDLTCMLPLSRYPATTADDFLIGIDFRTLIQQSSPQAAVEVINTPEYIRNITLSQDSIEYIINDITSLGNTTEPTQ